MLVVKNLEKSYGKVDVLKKISFNISRGQKIALVGYNGSGKSTILKIIAGIETPDSGIINFQGNFSIGYLPQEISVVGDLTIEKYIKDCVGITDLEEEIKKLEKVLGKEKNQIKYANLQEKFLNLGGYNFDHKINIMLDGFGFKETSKETCIANLSGGEKNKIAIIAILLKGVDLLILDEPTNNLDLPALIWLEQFLSKTKATCLIVSHDKIFLDKITSKVIEVDWFTREVTEFHGSYSKFINHKEHEFNRKKEEFKLQQNEIQRLNNSIEQKNKFAYQGSKQFSTDNDKMARDFRRDRSSKLSKNAKSIKNKLERMEILEDPQKRDSLSITINESDFKSKPFITIRDLVSGYENGFSIGPLSFSIYFKDRVGILGYNGSGKSTILNTISGNLQAKTGTVTKSPNIRIGNLIQETNQMSENISIFNYLQSAGNGIEERDDIYNLAVKFNFDPENINNLISKLSPGEKTRLILASFAIKNINTLILDEPTNHLDLDALDALSKVLENFNGSLLLVSHDRDFIQKVNLNKIYTINEDGNFKEILNYLDYIKNSEKRASKLIRTL